MCVALVCHSKGSFWRIAVQNARIGQVEALPLANVEEALLEVG